MTHGQREQEILDLAAARMGGDQAPANLHATVVPERLGSELANELRRFEPNVVVLWSDVETGLLGHVVARELHAAVIHGFADEGVLTLSTIVGSGEKVALVGYDWTGRPGLDALVQLVHTRGGEVVAIGSVLPAEHDVVPVVTLAGATS